MKTPSVMWKAGRELLFIGDDLIASGMCGQDSPQALLKAAQDLRRLADKLSHAARHGATKTAQAA